MTPRIRLRVVCGLLQPEEGEVAWNGVPIREANSEFLAALAYLAHDTALKADLTALENLAFSVGVRRAVTSNEIRSLLREARGLPADTVELRLPADAVDEWPFRVELLPLDALLVDDTYQRPVSWLFVRNEAARFDASLVGTIDVAQRSPSQFAILDGQQRSQIVRLVGKRTIWASVRYGTRLP